MSLFNRISSATTQPPNPFLTASAPAQASNLFGSQQQNQQPQQSTLFGSSTQNQQPAQPSLFSSNAQNQQQQQGNNLFSQPKPNLFGTSTTQQQQQPSSLLNTSNTQQQAQAQQQPQIGSVLGQSQSSRIWNENDPQPRTTSFLASSPLMPFSFHLRFSCV